jgi:hypothetical protein
MDALADYSSDDSEEALPSSTKKPKLSPEFGVSNRYQVDDVNDSIQENRLSLLEPPPLSKDSMIFGEIDLFSAKYAPSLRSRPSNQECSQNQKDIASSPTDWVQQIQSGHEFHNPAFFQSALQTLGVEDELGTNVACQELIYPYELDLVRLEEEARIRQYQNAAVATPSPFAQQQLERVMQQRR